MFHETLCLDRSSAEEKASNSVGTACHRNYIQSVNDRTTHSNAIGIVIVKRWTRSYKIN